jgi:hypothetical protein
MARTLGADSAVRGRDSGGSTVSRQASFAFHHLALQRLQAKQQIIAELIEGRLHLLEATVRFRAAAQTAGAAEGRELPGTKCPEDGEELCRSVIGWAHLALRDRPERAEAFSDQLERELQAHLARHGGVQLPCA